MQLLMLRKIFPSLLNTCKDSYKLLIISQVSCSDEFFIKRLVSSKKKKKKKERKKKERSYSPYS